MINVSSRGPRSPRMKSPSVPGAKHLEAARAKPNQSHDHGSAPDHSTRPDKRIRCLRHRFWLSSGYSDSNTAWLSGPYRSPVRVRTTGAGVAGAFSRVVIPGGPWCPTGPRLPPAHAANVVDAGSLALLSPGCRRTIATELTGQGGGGRSLIGGEHKPPLLLSPDMTTRSIWEGREGPATGATVLRGNQNMARKGYGLQPHVSRSVSTPSRRSETILNGVTLGMSRLSDVSRSQVPTVFVLLNATRALQRVHLVRRSTSSW